MCDGFDGVGHFNLLGQASGIPRTITRTHKVKRESLRFEGHGRTKL